MITDPYDDDDDSPTLQRPPTASNKVQPMPAEAFFEERSTDTDLVPIEEVDEHLADAHTVDSLPPAEAVALMDAPDDAPDCTDMETPKIPLDVAAVLLRASQDDDDTEN